MEATLDSQGSALTEEQKNNVLQAIQQQYNDKKSAISDTYRIQELEAERANDANIEAANKERADKLAAQNAKEDALEVALLNDKNAKLAQAEKDANAEIAKINLDRNATIKEIEADRDEIEKKHSDDLKLIATQREKDLTAIAQQGALDRYNIQKEANDKLGIATPAFNPSQGTAGGYSNPAIFTQPVGFVGPLASNQQYAPSSTYDYNSSISSLLSMYDSAKNPGELASDIITLVQGGGGGYGDAIKLADLLGSKKNWINFAVKFF